MSGGLARLVLRAQGRLPVAAPLLPSRFAPVASVVGTDWAGMDAEDEAPATTSTQRTAPSPRRRPDPPQRAEAEPREPTTRPQDAAPPRTPAGREPDRDATGPVRDEPTVSPTAIGAAPRTIPPETVEPSPATSAGTPRPSPARAYEAAPPLPPRRRIEPPAVPPASPLAARIAAPASAPELRRLPDVHISIGRLEVHASPARVAPARATPARGPRVTLADYLAQRK